MQNIDRQQQLLQDILEERMQQRLARSVAPQRKARYSTLRGWALWRGGELLIALGGTMQEQVCPPVAMGSR